MADRPLPLDDVDFWTDPKKGMEAISDDLWSRSFTGLLADAPREVDLAARATLPVVVYNRGTIADSFEDHLDRRLIVAAVRLETNELSARIAIQPKEGKGRPEGKPPQGFVTDHRVVDARERLGLPWDRSSTLALHALCFDQVAAPMGVSIARHALGDPAVRQFLEARRRPGYPRAVWPKAATTPHTPPTYKPLPRSPQLPDAGAGIVMAAPRVTMLEPGARVPLLGRFRTTVLAREWVKPRPEVPAGQTLESTGWVDVGDPHATGVVPLHLLITGRQGPGPFIATLQVPIYDMIEPGAAEQLVEGAFAIDLLGLGSTFLPDTYCIYAFTAAQRTGPIKVALVTPGMVPPPGE